MMIHRIRLMFGFGLSLLLVAASATSIRAGATEDGKPASGVTGPAAPAPRPELPGPKYSLRYKFEPGETIRWKVEHRAEVRTTVNGSTQTAETQSNSVKVWKVTSVDGLKKQAKFVHLVESVDMRQVVSGRQEVRYNSQSGEAPPPGFENVAKDVGVPLSEFTIDLRGYVLRRDEKRKDSQPSQGEITIPLPDHEVAIGEVWSQPNMVTVKYKDGSPKQIKTRQDYKLVEVDHGVATILLETTIVTPNNDPTIDAQLIQQVVDGTIRFDIKLGRVISQQTDIDKHVVGFQGDSSSLHYVTRFTERLTNEEGALAGVKAPTGPAPPPTAAAQTPPVKSPVAPAKTAQANTTQTPANKPATAKQSGPNKAPTAQTARNPAAKRPPASQAKQPTTSPKNVTPNKTARRLDPPAQSTTPIPPAPPKAPAANDVEPGKTDPDA